MNHERISFSELIMKFLKFFHEKIDDFFVPGAVFDEFRFFMHLKLLGSIMSNLKKISTG
jgi:hypothetical protein